MEDPDDAADDGAAEAFAEAGFYSSVWAIEQLFRTFKTEGFNIERLTVADDAARRRLIMAALVAAVTVRQLDHARDGAGAPSSLRPLADAIDAVDLPLLKAFTPSCRAGPSGRKTPIPKARSPTRPGCAPASAAGQATTANQPLSSCSTNGSPYKPPKMAQT